MGSFNVTCSLSNIIIEEGQKASVKILVPSYSKSFESHRALIVANSGCQCFFSPFGFPIHGVYNDYGRISDIKQDINVKMLEDFFSLDILSIIDSTRDDLNDSKYDDITNRDILSEISITFFRTEVLDYINSSVDNINLENLDKFSIGSYLNEILLSIEKKSEIEEKRKKLKSILEKDWSEKDEKVSRELFIDSIKNMNFSSYIDTINSFDMFKKMPINLDFKDYIIKQYNLISIMSNELKILLKPSVYGSQYTNWGYKYKFNKAVNNIIVKDLEKGIEDYDDKEAINIVKTHNRENKLDNLFNE